jgi:hypothetical protein
MKHVKHYHTRRRDSMWDKAEYEGADPKGKDKSGENGEKEKAKTEGEKVTEKGMKGARGVMNASASATGAGTAEVGKAMAMGMAMGARRKGNKIDKANFDNKEKKKIRQAKPALRMKEIERTA